MRTGALDRLDDVVEAPDSSRVGVNVRVTDQLVHDLLLSAPVIAETPEMRNDEVDLRVLWGDHFNHEGLANHVHEDREPKRLRGFANLS